MRDIKDLSRAEKLRTMETLWDDLTHTDEELPSPEWHGEALDNAERAVASGEAQFVDLETAKQTLRHGRR